VAAWWRVPVDAAGTRYFLRWELNTLPVLL